jgi:Helix-turn-helix domain/Arabinose-binding domain of AraC transcription regulator, N-term
MRIDIEGGEVRIGFHGLRADEKLPPMLIDGAFAHILAMANRGTGKPLTPLRAELARRRSNEAMLERRACEVSFDASADVLVLDEAALARPFLTRNADLHEVLLPELEASLRERMGYLTFADASPNKRRATKNCSTDVRDNTARRLLLDTDLDAGEIAFLLGFDELNSFTRAFHGWQGATPIRWRQFHESRTNPEAVSAAALGARSGGLKGP